MDNRRLVEGPQTRTFSVEERSINVEARTVEVAISSEYPVDRWGLSEVLVHEPGAVRLERLKNKGALLFNHDRDVLLGVVEDVRLDGDRRLRAVVRFSQDEEAQRRFAQVSEGVLCHISIGYSVLGYEEVPSTTGGPPVLRIKDWEPYEVSFVTVPADPSVGKGRALGGDEKNALLEPEETVQTEEGGSEVCVEEPVYLVPAKAEGERVMEVAASVADPKEVLMGMRDLAVLADAQNPEAVALDAFSRGLTADNPKFRDELVKLKEAKRVATPNVVDTVKLDLSPKDVQRYSIRRAILGSIPNSGVDWGYEREISQEVATRTGKSPNGFYVPYEAMSRAIGAGSGFSAAAGSNTVPADMLGFIDMLVNDLPVMGMGATMLTGLQGNVQIPRLNQGLAAQWIAEGAAKSADDPVFTQVTMSPKTLSAKAQYTRQFLTQTSLDGEALVVQQLARASAFKLQDAIINGAGTATEPQGILGLAGQVSVAAGTNGGALTRAMLVDLEAALAAAGPASRNLKFLTNPKVRGAMKKALEDAGSGQFVWKESPIAGGAVASSLVGYPVEVTNAVPSNLTKGSGTNLSALIMADWSELIIGNWGALDLQTFVLQDGLITVQAMQFWDLAYKHVNSFGVIKDIIT